MEIYNLFRILLYVGPIQSYLYLKMDLPPVLKAVSSGIFKNEDFIFFLNLLIFGFILKISTHIKCGILTEISHLRWLF
jgi:hypothetical protein